MGEVWRKSRRRPARPSVAAASHSVAAALALFAVLALAAAVSKGFTLAGEAVASASNPATAAYFSKQWGLAQIGAASAWQFGTGSGIKIGIVDTGVDLSQQDLLGKVAASTTIMSSPSRGCATPQNDPNGQDDEGHGTHVAGIAAAAGTGVAGVAPGAQLVVAKVLDCSGSGQQSDVASGIAWVVAHGARVVNLSLGPGTELLGLNCVLGGCDTTVIASAVQQAWNDGAVPVVAAGNNAGELFGPSGYGNLNAVVVAATGSTGQFAADYSSTPGNAEWGVLAPGGDDQSGPSSPACGTYDPYEILSTYWTTSDPVACYATDEGTSMATPFVSGTLALLLGRGLNQREAVQTLLSTLNTSVGCGAGQGCRGLVDAGAAMAAAARMTGDPSSQPSSGQSATSLQHATTSPRSGSSSASVPATTARRGDTAAAVSPTNHRSTSRLGSESSGATRGSSSNPLLFVLVALAAVIVVGVGTIATKRYRRTHGY